MRFVILVKASETSEAGGLPDEKLLTEQVALAERDPNGHELRVRIGLHTGEPVREADDFYGKAVILAAPIAAQARGSEILVSSLVRELTESTGEFTFEAPTDAELKGLSGMHRLSAVRWAG